MLTDFCENKILDAIFGRRAWSGKPTTLHFSAWTVGPDDTGAGGTEVTGGGYARKAVAVDALEWSECTDAFGVGISNLNQIAWNMATASWGSITHIGIHTAASGGNLLAVIALAAPVPIGALNVLKAEAGSIVVRFAGNVGNAMGCQILNYLFRGASLSVPTNLFVGLGLGASATDLQGELTANSYERLMIPNTSGAWPVAASGSKSVVLASNLLFPTATASWGSPTHYGLFSTGLVWVGCTLNSTTDVFTAVGHPFQNGDELFMTATTTPATSPANNLKPGVPLYVINRTADTFQLSLTVGGAAINATSTGSGLRVRKSTGNGDLLWAGPLDSALSIVTSDRVIIANGAITVSLD